MYPVESRVKELRDRFGVHNGQFFGHYKYKNLNWYLATSETPTETDEWFCFGDILDEHIPRLQEALQEDEYLILGWKELGANQKFDRVFRDGGGIWLIIAKDKVVDAIQLEFENRRQRKTS